MTDSLSFRASGMLRTRSIGIDIGGSAVKAGIVDLERGELITARVVLPTPQPATPEALANTVDHAISEVIALAKKETAFMAAIAGTAEDLQFLPAGIAFPGVVKEGIVTFAFNLDDSWLGQDIAAIMSTRLGRACTFLNDADAAGLAEMTYGAGRAWRKKTVMMTTLGTGIGTALFTRGHLVPFTELGHIEIDGEDAELSTSAAAKVRLGLDDQAWTANLTRYYRELEKLINPDVFIVGGGISRDHQKWLHMVDISTPIVPASMFNDAGIIGAAVSGAQGSGRKSARRLSQRAMKRKRTGHR